LVYTKGITVEKKIKTKQKKNDDVSFLPMELPTEFLLSGNSVGKNMNIVHHVNYKGNHRRNCPSVFFRELQNYSLSNCTVNCCSLRTKSPTD